MPQVWEAHRDLSEAIGDSVGLSAFTQATPPTALPDGVVFSRTLRDSYLYRAIGWVYKTYIQGMIGSPNVSARNRALEMLFPNVIRTVQVAGVTWANSQAIIDLATSDVGVRPLMLLNVNATLPNNVYYPVPIKDSHVINAKMNIRNAQQSDAFCHYKANYADIAGLATGNTILHFYDPKNELATVISFDITYLPYPRDPSLATVAGAYLFTDPLDIEESHYSHVLALARLYAYTDSQDLDMAQFLNTELQLTMGK